MLHFPARLLLAGGKQAGWKSCDDLEPEWVSAACLTDEHLSILAQ